MRPLLTLSLAAAVAMGVTVAAQPAAAALAGTFDIKIWHATNPGSSASDPDEQALPTNPLVTPSAFVGDYTYTGSLSFLQPTGGTNDILAFLNSGGGSLVQVSGDAVAALGSIDLSTSGFKDTSLFEITGTLPAGNGVITHDDGVSLFVGGSNLIPGSSAPTTPTPTPYTTTGGAFALWYVEANGLPAQLNLAVPEPASLALLGLPVAGLLMARRRKAA